MRFLLIFLLLLVVAWRWRTWREGVHREASRKKTASPPTTDVLACRQCGVHIPANDAVPGALGTYCCVAHRSKMEP